MAKTVKPVRAWVVVTRFWPVVQSTSWTRAEAVEWAEKQWGTEWKSTVPDARIRRATLTLDEPKRRKK